jgi:aryl-alcohol dehydrogenase-like predicted oxidoreductase
MDLETGTPRTVSGRSLGDETAGTVRLGDRDVRRLGFGAMRVSGARNAEGRRDRAEAVRLCRRVYDRGVTFIDTANIYGYGQSEEIIAEALRPYPHDLLIASKAGFRPGKILPGHATLPPDGRPEHVKAECEASLRRLGVDCIELFQVHVPDPSVPYAETVGAFVELQQAGKIRHIGISNVSVSQLELARSMCEVVSVQNRFNAADRSAADLLSACLAAGIVFIPWQPGDLAGSPASRAVASIARERDATPQQVALAWLLRVSPLVLPIPGTSSIRHLDENVDAAWLELSDEQIARIDRAARPPEDAAG